jgi:hypothetical protein
MENTMMKKTVLVACVLSLAAFPAFAQSSQGKGGSDNGPTSNSATTNGSGPGEMGRTGGSMNNTTGISGSGTSGMVGAGTGSSAPSSSGNVGPGTNNNSGTQPGGR